MSTPPTGPSHSRAAWFRQAVCETPRPASPRPQEQGCSSPRPLRLGHRVWLALALSLGLAAEAHATPPRAPTLTVVGDVNFAGYPLAIAPFDKVRSLLASDLRIANAEGLLTDLPVAAYREARLDITAPAAAARHFQAFDLVGLANNHTWDGGAAGLRSQLATFASLKLTTFGAAPTREAAYAPARYRWDGAAFIPTPGPTPSPGTPCLAVLGATLKSNRKPPKSNDSPHAALATTDETRSDVLALVRAEHERGCFVLVSLHGGKEGASHPDAKTRAFGLALLDAGADLVAAHHPHVLQGLELRKTTANGAPRLQAIAWSLGNFVFRNRTPEKRQTAVLHATLRQNDSRLELDALSMLPVHSDRELLPRPASPREAQAIARTIRERSARYGTEVTLTPDGRITLR